MLPTIAMTLIVTIVSTSVKPRCDRAWCTMVLVMRIDRAIPGPHTHGGSTRLELTVLTGGCPRLHTMARAIGAIQRLTVDRRNRDKALICRAFRGISCRIASFSVGTRPHRRR